LADKEDILNSPTGTWLLGTIKKKWFRQLHENTKLELKFTYTICWISLVNR